MGWTDGLGESDFLMPWFGISGIILFIFICLFTYCEHREIMADGTQMKVVSIGTCTRSECVIQVSDVKLNDAAPLEKVTSSKVFVGDLVMCGSEDCYKD